MCLDRVFKRFLKLPKKVITVHIFAKFLFGLGLGVLLAQYCQCAGWVLLGWGLIAVSILLALPGAYCVLKK